jgi:rRNA maturation endonuclease Nob1
MAASFSCFDCKRVFFGVETKKCPSCGGTNGETLSEERVEEGLKSGAIRNHGKAPKQRR